MFPRPFSIFKIELPVKRPFDWRVCIVLVVLYFLGNLSGIPLLRKTNAPVEPIWFWGLATLISGLVIALSLVLANRVGLGAPLVEGRIPRGDLWNWLRSGLALTVLILVVGFPFSLIANLGADPETYPFGWELLLASFKAGVVEEIGYRFFVITLFTWIGGTINRDAEGRPTSRIYWGAILLAGLIFGWAHVDARLSISGVPFLGYALIMMWASALGIYFGWLFWKLGIEWAVLAHFAYDAFISMIVIPVYLLKSPVVWASLIIALAFAFFIAWRSLRSIAKNLTIFK